MFWLLATYDNGNFRLQPNGQFFKLGSLSLRVPYDAWDLMSPKPPKPCASTARQAYELHLSSSREKKIVSGGWMESEETAARVVRGAAGDLHKTQWHN